MPAAQVCSPYVRLFLPPLSLGASSACQKQGCNKIFMFYLRALALFTSSEAALQQQHKITKLYMFQPADISGHHEGCVI